MGRVVMVMGGRKLSLDFINFQVKSIQSFHHADRGSMWASEPPSVCIAMNIIRGGSGGHLRRQRAQLWCVLRPDFRSGDRGTHFSLTGRGWYSARVIPYDVSPRSTGWALGCCSHAEVARSAHRNQSWKFGVS